MLRRSLLVLVALSITVGAALADDGKPGRAEVAQLTQCIQDKRRSDKPENGCIFTVASQWMERPSGHNTLGQRQCNTRETVIWDDVLNRRYRRLRGVVSADGRETLKRIQALWIKWRNTKCEMPYVLFEGGTMAGPLAAGCVLKATALRAIEMGDALDSMGEKP